jgi:hypothetical protein
MSITFGMRFPSNSSSKCKSRIGDPMQHEGMFTGINFKLRSVVTHRSLFWFFVCEV